MKTLRKHRHDHKACRINKTTEQQPEANFGFWPMIVFSKEIIL